MLEPAVRGKYIVCQDCNYVENLLLKHRVGLEYLKPVLLQWEATPALYNCEREVIEQTSESGLVCSLCLASDTTTESLPFDKQCALRMC